MLGSVDDEQLKELTKQLSAEADRFARNQFRAKPLKVAVQAKAR